MDSPIFLETAPCNTPALLPVYEKDITVSFIVRFLLCINIPQAYSVLHVDLC